MHTSIKSKSWLLGNYLDLNVNGVLLSRWRRSITHRWSQGRKSWWTFCHLLSTAPLSKPQPPACAKVEGKGSGKVKPNWKCSFDSPKSSAQRPPTAKSSLAVKAIETDGWVLYDNTNPSGYGIDRSEQLKGKAHLAVRTPSSHGINLCFEFIGVYRKLLRLNDADKSMSDSLRQYCFSLSNVWEDARLPLKRASKLPSLKSVLFGFQMGIIMALRFSNNLVLRITSTPPERCYAAKQERAHRPRTFFAVGFSEPDIDSVLGCWPMW